MQYREQVPSLAEQVAHVADDMTVAAILGRQQVARPGVMPARCEGTSNDARRFAANQTPKRHAHDAASNNSGERSAASIR